MATKLGDRLIAKGAINSKQLEMALKAQLIVLGMIDEAALGLALSEAFGVPHAPPEALHEIPEATITLVPSKVAEEYKVIPFRISDKVLHMAMVDPSNLPTLDALSFATDRRIVPWVAPELRIYQALEQYYKVPRRLRYIGICRALDNAAAEKAREAKASAAGAGNEAGKPTEAPGGSGPAAALGMIGGTDQDFADFQYGKTWHDVAAELRLDEVFNAPAPKAGSANRAVGTPAKKDEGPKAMDLVEVADRLCRAERKDDIAEAVLSYAGTRMAHCILFTVQEGVATVWRSHGFSQDPSREARIPLTSGAFGLLLGNELYRGVVPREDKYETFYRQLGIEQPGEVLLVPVYLSDRLVAIFHGAGGTKKRIEGETDDYERLIRLFSLTLNLLVMKNRIRDTAYPPPEVRKKNEPAATT